MAQAPDFTSPNQDVPCQRHPDTMTRLRCNRCGTPICPKCSFQSPVGRRCPVCAGKREPATVKTGPDVLVRAGAAGLVIAALVGVVWAQIPDWGFYLALLLGFGVAETMARIAGNKRGRDLQLVGMALVVGAIVLSRWLLFRDYGLSLGDIGQLPPAGQAALHVRLIPDYLFAAMPVLIVWYRFK